ncbi:MAG TPA: DNA gyrase inhibitor YacG [Burkholderiales bacterium]|nr:DNA gyrase inhibitor YacG [Burkholderiales bacterium]
MQSVRIVRCPRCGGRTEYSRANEWRPFCSERCRMVDLGRWAAEEYRLPEQDDPSAKLPES